jgi:hypothetical protein
MTLFQLIFVPLCTAFALVTLYRVRLGHLARRQGVLWALVWTAGAALISIPDSTMVVASWLQIGRGADLVFYLAILAGLGACLYFYASIRRLEIVVTELVRRETLDHPLRGGHDDPRAEREGNR